MAIKLNVNHTEILLNVVTRGTLSDSGTDCIPSLSLSDAGLASTSISSVVGFELDISGKKAAV